MPLTNLSLQGCKKLIDLGLDPLRGMPLARVCLTGSVWLTPRGMDCFRGMPLACLDLRNCPQAINPEGLDVLEGMPLTSLRLGVDFSRGSIKGRTPKLTDDCMACLRGLPLTNLDVTWAAEVC